MINGKATKAHQLMNYIWVWPISVGLDCTFKAAFRAPQRLWNTTICLHRHACTGVISGTRHCTNNLLEIYVTFSAAWNYTHITSQCRVEAATRK